jgi:SAM-dependent methyltransferase
MSGFSKAWLSLREEADFEARAASLLSHFDFSKSGVLRVIDLGAGTGSNLRYLAPHIPCAQNWTLIDADRALLDAVSGPAIAVDLNVTLRQLDLMQDLGAVPFDECDLITASALFDLVSEAWVDRLAKKCAEAKIRYGLFATSVDGYISWTPVEPDDNTVSALFNAHMRRDKGFGPALGQDAPQTIEKCFAAAGYRVFFGDSAWRLAAEDAELQSHLLHGYVEASVEQAPEKAEMVRDWAARRRTHIAQGNSELIVGHRDVLVRLD